MSDANNRTNDQIESAVDHGDHERPDDEDRAEDTIVVAMAAGQLRQGAKDVELREAPTVPGTETILAWGYFNPFGPTANRIDVLPAADTGELLLIRASNHESSPDYRAIALIPPGVNQAAAIRDALTPIFAANGRRDEWVIVGGVPSYVHLIPESPVDHSCAAELFRSANATAGELGHASGLLPGDPGPAARLARSLGPSRRGGESLTPGSSGSTPTCPDPST